MTQQTDIAGHRRTAQGLRGRAPLGLGAIAGLGLIAVLSAAALAGVPQISGAVLGVGGLAGVGLVLLSLLRRGAEAGAAPAAAPAPGPETEVQVPAARERDIADGTAAALTARIEELESAQSHAEHLLSRLIGFAPLGIVLSDSAGTVLRANANAGQMAGLKAAPVGGRFVDLFAESDRAAAQEQLDLIIAGEQRQKPVELKLAGPAERVALLYGGFVDDDDRGERLAAFYLIDATDQRSLEAQFAQGQKMQAVGQLAGGVAHDFNNLLTAMIGFADLLLMRHPPGDPSYTDIVHIKQNANRAAALVRQLLAFSRRQTLRPKILNLTDVLTDISDLLRRLIGEHINLRIVHERDLGLVKADQGQIEQVVTNLVVNARDAMTAGGTVTIETRNLSQAAPRQVGDETMSAGEYVEIEVTDTGHGISEEHLEKIFEPFFTTKAIGHGTGLGLATVYGIVRQTGGFVEVESRQGEGTSFRIILPQVRVDPAAGEGALARRAAVDLTGSGTVLLVEDEDAVRLFAARALRNKGYTVVEAESGEIALEIIKERNAEIDLMISDVVMPNMDGPTLIRHARELRADIRAIFISGYAEEAFRRSLGDDLGDVDFLPKPFSLKQLAAKVKEQLER
ncbi:ATP-binding protein [Minwuia thermotolerans]|uniref:histidine kinase n=1 Tax=Minwuia thermotolerans TaxID=2056226 RepID=A0A2M9G6R0_9PROT|nr:ATP-binding protein [Minwuia thermotolerans]PJK31405.1 hybrid sensor histidine kinase/response regulator [Minwuia thermotolerans]